MIPTISNLTDAIHILIEYSLSRNENLYIFEDNNGFLITNKYRDNLYGKNRIVSNYHYVENENSIKENIINFDDKKLRTSSRIALFQEYSCFLNDIIYENDLHVEFKPKSFIISVNRIGSDQLNRFGGFYKFVKLISRYYRFPHKYWNQDYNTKSAEFDVDKPPRGLLLSFENRPSYFDPPSQKYQQRLSDIELFAEEISSYTTRGEDESHFFMSVSEHIRKNYSHTLKWSDYILPYHHGVAYIHKESGYFKKVPIIKYDRNILEKRFLDNVDGFITYNFSEFEKWKSDVVRLRETVPLKYSQEYTTPEFVSWSHPSSSSHYNDALDMDQQSLEFWDDL